MMNRVKFFGITVGLCALIVAGLLIGARLVPYYLAEPDHHDDHMLVSHSSGRSTHSQSELAHSDAASSDPDGVHDPSDTEPSIVELTMQAMKNLQLEEQQVELSDSWRYIRVPARVVEKPGLSNHSVAAPINGIVKQIFAVPGQAVSPGDDLFDLRVTDEQLSKSQIELLQVMTRMDVIDIEKRRIGPLIESGAMSGKVLRELEYERRELEAKTGLHTQELLMRGLSEEQVQTIVKKRELIRDFRVRLVGHGRVHGDQPHVEQSSTGTSDPDYSVEELMALPGATVKRGDDLCRMAYHTELYLHGRAFENELKHIVEVSKEGRTLIGEFGIAGAEYRRDNLKVEYIDNHVNAENQTFSFYVPLRNEVQRDHITRDGVRHRTWLFKPGQRANLLVPVEQWKNQIRLPLKAIVQEGANVYVFREFGHDHDEADPSLHDHADFERVAVHLLYQDGDSAVIANDGSLNVGDVIAANCAYQLNLELKAASGGGGGHHHAHDH
jgi:multidrug efflux pump subunit AcrA (membrane-fusion protein)